MTSNTPSEAWLAFRRVYWSLAAMMAALLLFLALMGFGPAGRKCAMAAAGAGETKTALEAPSDTAGSATSSCRLSLSIVLRWSA